MSKSCWRARVISAGVRERGIWIMGVERGEGAGSGSGMGAGSFIVSQCVGWIFCEFFERGRGSEDPLEGRRVSIPVVGRDMERMIVKCQS